MSPLLLVAVMAVGAEKAEAPKVDGKWLIVYAEEGGKRNTAWEQKQATLSDNKLSYKDGDNERSLSLKFGHHQDVKATFAGKEGDFSGVYIAAQDYLCISLNPEKAKGAAAPAEKGAATRAAAEKAEEAEKKGASSGAFVLILRRQQK